MDERVVFLAAFMAMALALTGVLAAAMWFLSKWFPDDSGNRPVPPHVLTNREQARLDALQRIAARQRRSL